MGVDDRIENTAQDLGGKAKEAHGKMTGDDREVADLAEAEAIAAGDQLARFGALELRPVWPLGSEG